MDIKFEKQGRTVAIVETVFNVLLGIYVLFNIIGTITLVNSHEFDDRVKNILVIASVFVSIWFLINLGLLILLWKAVLQKSYGQCTGWYVTQSVFTILSLMIIIYSFFTGFQWFVFMIFLIQLTYRLWSIYVIKSLGSVILANRGMVSYSEKV